MRTQQSRVMLNLVACCCLAAVSGIPRVVAETPAEFSTAGFYRVDGGGRQVVNFNVGWRFFEGNAQNAFESDFDDSQWSIVNCPHGIEVLPAEASGGRNYHGPVWYRKRFPPGEDFNGKLVDLHFEAVMGKCKVWLNGELITSHTGRYLPFRAALTGKLKLGEENVVVVWADNSNDSSFPPGKPQNVLDFTYFGGIYRDVWLVATNKVHVTEPTSVDKVAGGGVFVHFENFSRDKVTVVADVDVANAGVSDTQGVVEIRLVDPMGQSVTQDQQNFDLKSETSDVVSQQLNVENLGSGRHRHLIVMT